MKLMPTVVQAVALVVFIHIVGQVNKLLVILDVGRDYKLSIYCRVYCPGMAAQNIGSASPMAAQNTTQTKCRK